MKKLYLIHYCILLSMVFSQVTITVDDLKYEIGGNYSMYDIPAPQGVIGLTGNTGGPLVFDFSEGVTAGTHTFTYVDVNDGGHGGSFPGAEIAEKKTNENGTAWMYLNFEEGAGRQNFGFYDAVNLPDSPAVTFNPVIVDFPDNLTYQSYFTGSTNFSAFVGNYELDIEYNFTGFVDGYGSIILPDDMGTHECIQVNYSEEYVYYFYDTPIQYSYVRSYYYLAEGIGIAAIVTSLDSDNPVPNDFNVANTIARLYDTSKPLGLAGDVNSDGIINVLDVVIIVNVILDGDVIENGDLNGDGQVNVVDIVLLVNIILENNI